MKRRSLPYYLLALVGAALFAVGLCGISAAVEAKGIMRTLPYLGIGIGSGLFGHGVGELINRAKEKRNPGAARTVRIEKNDERTIAVTNRSKAKALDTMIYVFAALNLAFVLMGVDVLITLLSIFAYLFVLGSMLYYWIKLNKEM